jgi:diguanylate cyclase (GGDEF)-like protein
VEEFSVEKYGDVFGGFMDLLSPLMNDYLFFYDFKKDLYSISPQAAERFRIPSSTFFHVKENHMEFVHPKDRTAILTELNELEQSADRDDHDMTYRWLSVEGDPVWINCRGKMVRDKGMPRYLIGCINEIGRRKIADNQTGLLGDISFQRYVEKNVNEQTEGYLLRLGLDDLKGINVRLGVEYGDVILRKTAESIAECIQPGQKLYRLVGDEYIVVDSCGGSAQDGYALYQAIRDRVDQFVADNNYEAVYTLSGGVVCFSDLKERSHSELMKFTEFTLDEAKRQGRNRCYIFRQEDYQQFLRRSELAMQLRKSVNTGFQEFEVYYQPIFNMDHETIYGAEALMRFHTEEMGMVSPAEFIPILEQTGLIIPAGRWILHQALQACKEFQNYIPDFHMNINLSNIQIMKSNICGEIINAVKLFDVAPETVTFELTESGMLESDYRFSKMWMKMKEEGFLLALDDFGSGYSNLRYINELRPDTIKIDRVFTVRAMENTFEYDLLSLLTKLSHDLKLNVCIEGIETEKEKATIGQLLPDYIQGFYFGRPCAKETFEQSFLKKA